MRVPKEVFLTKTGSEEIENANVNYLRVITYGIKSVAEKLSEKNLTRYLIGGNCEIQPTLSSLTIRLP